MHWGGGGGGSLTVEVKQQGDARVIGDLCGRSLGQKDLPALLLLPPASLPFMGALRRHSIVRVLLGSLVLLVWLVGCFLIGNYVLFLEGERRSLCIGSL